MMEWDVMEGKTTTRIQIHYQYNMKCLAFENCLAGVLLLIVYTVRSLTSTKREKVEYC